MNTISPPLFISICISEEVLISIYVFISVKNKKTMRKDATIDTNKVC